jgi:predicted glycosyltransferase
LEELLDAIATCAPRPYLVVRLHPKNVRADFAAYEPEVDGFDQGGDPHELLCVADAVIGMSSMLLQESATMGVRTLSIVPRPQEVGLLPMVRRGEIPVAFDRATILDALDNLLTEKAAKGPDRYRDTRLTVAQFIVERVTCQRKAVINQ